MSDWAEEDATRFSDYYECRIDSQGAADTVKGIYAEVVRLRAVDADLSKQVEEWISRAAEAESEVLILRSKLRVALRGES